MGEERALEIVEAVGMDRNRPLIAQISRFDLWKDPWGVHRRLSDRPGVRSGPAVGPVGFKPGHR